MRTISVLMELGFQPTFIGRKLADSQAFEKEYPSIRFKLPFHKGFLFYASYNLRLFWHFLFHRYDLYLSNDLDTLLPNYLIAKIRGKPLVYDSHEYFCGVPEIQNRPLVKQVWTKLERAIFPRLKWVVTVNESIADMYREEYDVPIQVVRNIGDSRLPQRVRSRAELGLPEDKFILINQGAGINIDRGMEEAVMALNHLPEDVVLLIVGNGDALPALHKMVREMELEDRVIFRGKQPYLQLLEYTLNADCGLSLDKPKSVNYRYSLPNKLFDYIKCGIPVLASPVVEVKKVVEAYQIGALIESHDPEEIARKSQWIRAQGKAYFSLNLQKAAAENNWEEERKTWVQLFSRFL